MCNKLQHFKDTPSKNYSLKTHTQICLVLSIVSKFVHPYCCCLYNLNCVCLPKSILHDLCSSARMLLYAFLGVLFHFTSSGWCPYSDGAHIQMKVHFPFNFGRIGRNKVATMNNKRDQHYFHYCTYY